MKCSIDNIINYCWSKSLKFVYCLHSYNDFHFFSEEEEIKNDNIAKALIFFRNEMKTGISKYK